WWDYGYYITSQGDTISLADNATSNSTQIGVVGTMLMWNETAAINLMYQYNVNYVLVVPAGGQLGLGSDIGKSIWMIRIAEQYASIYGIKESDYFSGSTYVDKYYDSVLYRLMAYISPTMNQQSQYGQVPFANDQQLSGGLLPELESHRVNELEYFTEVFRSTGLVREAPGDFPMVRIFRVDYPQDIELRVNEFQMKISAQ
ncbi:MAG: hypothetical protein ACXADH_05720, partial [Candidatus Kariarchaeaceae archaeon]